MIQLFPAKNLEFKLINSAAETLERLERRTEKLSSFSSAYTSRSFRGIISGNTFKIISSVPGSGAFCVLQGVIASDHNCVRVEINNPFKVLLTIILVLPLIASFAAVLAGSAKFSVMSVIVPLLQIVMLRYLLIEASFKFLSERSLNRFRDVLDIEWL